MNEPAADTLAAALARYQIDVPADRLEKLDQYCRLLWDWNEKINLTRHTDYERFVSRDVLDSHQLATQLASGETALDFGTGGGVPGLVIAILRPDVRVSVCESVGKKARVLESMVKELGLSVPVHAKRVEAVLERHKFDVLMARAVGSMSDVCKWLAPYWHRFGRLLLVKGPKWVDERGEARHFGLLKGLALRVAAAYPMPGTESESVILRILPGERLAE
ncbi:MAG: 16S rRNA (guanine(527)-N(7))-methyltransferase RsmG [Pirellulales bacterium]